MLAVTGDMFTDTTDIALGLTSTYYGSGMRYYTVTGLHITTSYYSICLSLNILLTFMIVLRLIVHIRNIRNATGASDGYSGLHTAAATVIVILIESYALYAGVLLAYAIPLAMNSWVATLFSKVIGAVQVRALFPISDAVLVLLFNYGCTQVIAPYLIVLRVAKRRAMTSESISEVPESVHFRSQGSMDDDGFLPGGDLTNVTEVNVEAPSEPGAGDEYAIEEVPL